MASYNEIDGVPSHANHWLLTDVLRGEWGYRGAVVSDYYAIEDLARLHHIAADNAGAARRSEEHTSELQSLMRSSYAVFCLEKQNPNLNTILYLHSQTNTPTGTTIPRLSST